MKSQKASLQDLEQGIALLPQEAQYAIAWIINNTDLVDRMVEEPIDKTCWNEFMEKAIQQKDYFIQALLIYHQSYHSQNDEIL